LQNAVPDVDVCYKKGLDITDWDKTAKAFGLNSVKGSNPFTAKELAGYISHGPVLVHGKFLLGYHSIVVTGIGLADYPWEDDTVTYINPFWQGTKSVKERTGTFKIYLKLGVENNNGIAGVLQYWS
jgi:hypothetical protein